LDIQKKKKEEKGKVAKTKLTGTKQKQKNRQQSVRARGIDNAVGFVFCPRAKNAEEST